MQQQRQQAWVQQSHLDSTRLITLFLFVSAKDCCFCLLSASVLILYESSCFFRTLKASMPRQHQQRQQKLQQEQAVQQQRQQAWVQQSHLASISLVHLKICSLFIQATTFFVVCFLAGLCYGSLFCFWTAEAVPAAIPVVPSTGVHEPWLQLATSR